MGPGARAFCTATAGYFLFFILWAPLLDLLSRDSAPVTDWPDFLFRTVLGGPVLGVMGLVLVIGLLFWLAVFFTAFLPAPQLERLIGPWPQAVLATVMGAALGGLGSVFSVVNTNPDHLPGLVAGAVSGALSAALFHALKPKTSPLPAPDRPS